MTLGELEKELKSGKPRQCYFLYGEDEGFIKETVDKIKNVLGIDTEDIFSYTKLNGQNLDSERLFDELTMLPVMTDRKLIEIIRADFFSGDRQYKNSDVMMKEIGEFMSDPPENIYLIIYYVTSLEKKDTKIKALEKKTENSSSAFVKMPSVKKEQIEDFLEDYFREKDINVTRPVLAFIRETFEGNIMQLRNDLDKIIAYAGKRAITREDVSLLITKSSTRHKFDLLDLIMEGRPREAMELYNELIYKRAEPVEILEGLGSRIREAYNYKVAQGLSMDVKEGMEYLGERFTWLYERKKKTYGRITAESLNRMFKRLIEAETKFKSTSTDQKREVELLILSVSSAVK